MLRSRRLTARGSNRGRSNSVMTKGSPTSQPIAAPQHCFTCGLGLSPQPARFAPITKPSDVLLVAVLHQARSDFCPVATIGLARFVCPDSRGGSPRPVASLARSRLCVVLANALSACAGPRRHSFAAFVRPGTDVVYVTWRLLGAGLPARIASLTACLRLLSSLLTPAQALIALTNHVVKEQSPYFGARPLALDLISTDIIRRHLAACCSFL